jgi:GNAT superfamily N-acetyltransferase
MKTTQRNYSEAAGDFNRLSRFVVEHHDYLRRHSTWCLGRLVDWKYGLYPNKTALPAFCEQNARLWFDGFGELAGFAISEEGDAGFAILLMEGYRFLFPELLDWVLANWGDREPRPNIEITAFQTAEAEILQRAGFRPGDPAYTRCFDLTQALPPRDPLPEGFTIVDMDAHPDYRAQRILRAEAFSGQSALSEEELAHQLAFYNHSQQGPIYHPQTDLCVMAEDGRLVSGCEALIDARNCIADIERVCTHSAFRRRGLARAVIQECLHRLQAMGMQRAYISGYSPGAIALYGSLGHADEWRFYTYRLAEG